MKENPIDKLFREKLNKPYKKYNHDHWVQAQALLNKFSKSRKSRRQWVALLLVLLSILLATSAYLYLQKKPVTPDSLEKMSDVPMASLHPSTEGKAISEANMPLAQPGVSGEETFISTKPDGSKPGSAALPETVPQEQNRAPGSDYDNSIVQKVERADRLDILSDRSALSQVPGNESQTRSVDYLVKLPVLEIQPNSDLAYNLSSGMAAPGTSLSRSFSGKVSLGWTGTLMLNPAIGNRVQGIQFGFVVEYPLSRQWVIGSKPHYHLTVNESGFSKFDQQVNFGFGSETTTYGLRANSLHFVSLPVYAGWKSSKHQIEIGGGVDILLAALGQLQEIELNTAQIRPLLELRSGWIETKEMQPLSLNLFAGYKLKLSSKLFSGFSVFYSPSQIYPGSPNNLPQTFQNKWHFGLQTNYYFK